MISQSTLLQLKEILELEFKLKLTMQEVAEIASALLGYFETLALIEKKTNSVKKKL